MGLQRPTDPPSCRGSLRSHVPSGDGDLIENFQVTDPVYDSVFPSLPMKIYMPLTYDVKDCYAFTSVENLRETDMTTAPILLPPLLYPS